MPLGKRADYGDSRYAGVEVDFCADIQSSLQGAINNGFDFIVTPLVDPLRRPPPPPTSPGEPIPPMFTPEEGTFLPSEWSNQVVGKISSWIDPDSSDARLAKQSEVALVQELGWATHLSLQAVLVQPPMPRMVNYTRILNQLLSGLHNMQVWVKVPVMPIPEVDEAGEGMSALSLNPDSGRAERDPYVWWDTMRSLADHSPQLGVCLSVGAALPPPLSLKRWMGEPLKSILLQTSAFTTNKRGFPVLSKRHQDFVTLAFNHNVQVLLSGESLLMPFTPPLPADSPASAASDFPPLGTSADAATGEGPKHGLQHYWEYLVYLFRRMDQVDDQLQFELSYRDYLQAPLQPLMDNLENQTYETFEKDSTKYIQYENAVFAALQDRVPPPSGVSVVMVVGAGRGPLVSASLRAAQRANRKIKVYAVEKNPNAVVTLQRHLKEDPLWGEGRVDLIHQDMRNWDAPSKADIMVSELLGSFGDNELSPECLDGAQRFLAEDGVSIPTSYTSYLAPMTSSKLYKDCKAYKDLEHFETAYVVKVHNVATLADPLPVFTFEHPNYDKPIDNTRYIHLSFPPLQDIPSATMHGFVGYFDAKLYGDVHISTYPPTHTPGMFSWFPIYFPLKDPVHIPVGRRVECSFWRCVSSSKVWYEWATTSPEVSHVHNVNGRSYWVGL